MSLARLVGALEEVEVPAGADIAREGAEADGLYLLERGSVTMAVRSEDGEATVGEFEAPAFFGEMGLLLARRTATIRARSASRLWRLPRERFVQLVGDRPEVGLAVAAWLAQRHDRYRRLLAGAPEADIDERPLAVDRPVDRPPRLRWLGAVLALAVPVALWMVPPPAGLGVEGWHVVALLLGAAVAWLTRPVPDFAVAIALAAAWGMLGLGEAAFSGFATTTWVLALGALTLAAAMARSGLLFRVALLLLRAFPATHRGQVLALIAGGTLLTPVVPQSVGRVAAIMPVTREVATALGHAPRSAGSAGIAFAGLVGYWYSSSVFLTGLATNFFVLELLGADDRVRFGFFGWLGAALVVGLVGLALATIAIFVLFPPERRAERSTAVVRTQARVIGPLTGAERTALLAAVILGAGFAAEPFLRVEPAWFALLSVVVSVLVIGRDGFRSGVDWAFLVFLAILLGAAPVLGAAGVDRWLADAIAPLGAAVGGGGVAVIGLAVLVVLVRFALPSRPTMLLLALVAMPAAPALGVSPWVAGVVVLLAANTWILPYQGMEYLVARDATEGQAFTDRQGTAMGAALTAIRLVAIAASVPYWIALGLVR